MLRIRSIFRPIAVLLVPVGFALFLYSQIPLQIGYAVIEADAGSGLPVATALFSSTNPQGFLIWEAGVAAVEPIAAGRVFVDQQAETRTAIALVNVGSTAVTVTFVLREGEGVQVAVQDVDFAAGQHRALFVDELFAVVPPDFVGSLTFQTQGGQRVMAAVTLRQNLNVDEEAIFATLPVAELDGDAGEGTIVFPHIGAGDGLSTQLVLISRSGVPVQGRILFFGADGGPLTVEMDGVQGSEFPYAIKADGVFFSRITSGPLRVGYAVVTLDQGDAIPAGSAIFQFTAAGRVISEAGVGAIAPTTQARIFVDNAGTRTGVALASPGNAAATVTFRLLARNGTLQVSTTREVAAGGHLSIFADELFQLPDNYTGLLEISSPVPVVPITLKLTISALTRGMPILTTLPVADLTRPPQGERFVLPQIGFGQAAGVGLFSTRLIVLNVRVEESLTGSLAFFRPDGGGLVVPLAGTEDSRFEFEVTAGGGRQFFPGVTAEIAVILVDESGLIVNDGQTIPLNPIILDEDGNVRDDFPLSFNSLTPATVSVDDSGNVTGVSRGFSTVTISSGGVVATVIVTVATITEGAAGFEATGIAQDFAARVYLSNTRDHTVLVSESLAEFPARYAGVAETAGLRNDQRLNALFNRPAFLALNQADGRIFVSDSANHVIRSISPGAQGRVETLAGTGQPGAQDGPLASASFNAPNGAAFDRRGNLWVVDTGSHTIRRIDLAGGIVETIAGQAGVPGSADGIAAAALFNAPAGIAFETEPLASQLERERTGQPPPPVTMIVADTGNDRLRRVREDGTVETVGSIAVAAARSGSGRLQWQQSPVTFRQPVGVVVDSFGNIYVSEGTTGRVRALLTSGEIVQAAQTGTFERPRGMAVTARGRVVVADSRRVAQEIRYAGPSIVSIEPEQISNRGGAEVRVDGRNFAQDTLVVVAGVVIPDVQLLDTQTLVFTAPPLPSGVQTLTLQHRGGLAQASLFVDAVPPEALAAGEITTVAGGTTFAGDGSAATAAALTLPLDLSFDAAGNLYLADAGSHRIRRVDAVTGVITTVAGNGIAGFTDGPASTSSVNNPQAVSIDEAGNLYFADTGNHAIRRLRADAGLVETLAGDGSAGFAGDEEPAAEARLDSPAGVATAPNGDVYIADTGNHRIRRIDGQTGVIVTVAGTGQAGFAGNGGPASQALFNRPMALLFDDEGRLWVADTGNHAIRRIEEDIVVLVAGTGEAGFAGDHGPAAEASLDTPRGLVVDADGGVLIADTGNQRIRRVDPATGVIVTVAGTGEPGFSGDGGPTTQASLNAPSGLAINAAQDFFLADSLNRRVRSIALLNGQISTVAGNGQLPGEDESSLATAALLDSPSGIGLEAGGELLIADSGHHRLRRLKPAADNGAVTSQGALETPSSTDVLVTIAGTGSPGFGGDGGPATEALLNTPVGVSAAPDGTRVFADSLNHRLRRLSNEAAVLSFVQLATTTAPAGIMTIAGTGEPGFSGDGGPALEAALQLPAAVIIDSTGNIVLADSENHRVRRIDANTGVIVTMAGTGVPGFNGDFRAANSANLNRPRGLVLGPDGSLFIADTGNHRIRRVRPDGQIVTVAGTGQSGAGGNGGPAFLAQLSSPEGLAVDLDGNLFVADTGNHRVLRIDRVTSIIKAVAGTGVAGFSGDNGPAVEARLHSVSSVAVDAEGNLYLADRGNHRIRLVRAPLP